MSNQPMLNVPGSQSSSTSGATHAATSGATSGGASASSPPTMRGAGRGKPDLPNPYQNARRKRAASRKKRRFDAVFARLPKPPSFKMQWPGVAVPAVLQPTPWSTSKLFSAILACLAVMSFYMLHTQEEWFVYREDVRFHNLIRMQGDDLYGTLNLDGLNIFWVEPEAIRAELLTLPWVEEAQVEVALPAMISVNVTEMTPAAVWVTNEGNYWLAMNGSALPIATLEESALPELALPQIIDTLQEARVVGDGPVRIDSQVLASALTLMTAMPELEGQVRYNRSIGLNFPLPEPNIWVYWGDGLDMETKLENLAVARAMLRTSEKQAHYVDVSLIDRPYVRFAN